MKTQLVITIQTRGRVNSDEADELMDAVEEMQVEIGDRVKDQLLAEVGRDLMERVSVVAAVQ